MATGLTTTYNIPFPLSTDPVNVHGDVEDLAQQVEDVLEVKADVLSSNTFTGTNTFDVNSSDPALLILQSGSGEALKIGDTNPFVVTAGGNVFVNTSESEQDLSLAFQVTGNASVSGTLSIGSVISFDGITLDENQTFLSAVDPTQDNNVFLPNANNVVLVGDTNAVTLTNKAINLATNTIVGTLSDFNAALQDGDFATLAGTETLLNKTIEEPSIQDPSFSGSVQTDLVLDASNLLIFEGDTDDANQIAISGGDPTASRVVTLPDAGGTFITTGNLDDAYPDQTNNEDRVLTTDGTDVFWGVGGTGGGGGLAWTLETETYQASTDEAVVADTSIASFTVTLPSNPQIGDKVAFVDYADSFATNPLIVEPSSNSSATIEGSTSLSLNVKGATVVLAYIDSTKGWRII